MRALVVYESMFGNTQTIAKAIATGLGSSMIVGIVEVGKAPTTIDGVDLLVVGGPTHAWSLTRPQTREGAARETSEALVSNGIGLREWLADLAGPSPMIAATFDTRFAKPRWITGSAARSAARRMRRKGYRIAGTESFFVTGTTGPLLDHEEQRARRWGEVLAVETAGGAEHHAS